MNKMINFPLYDLDMGPELVFGSESSSIKPSYDLYGVVVSDPPSVRLTPLIIESLWNDEWWPLQS